MPITPHAKVSSSPNAIVADDLGDEGLARRLGVRALAANIVNQVVGSGIFVFPAAVAAILGPAAAIAYVACAVGGGLIGLCYAEVGSRITRSGGTYAYISTALGPSVGFLGGVLLWFGSDVVSNAAISVVVVDSAGAALGGGLAWGTRAVVLFVLLAGLAAANIRGVATGATLVEVMTAAKLVPLLFVVALAFVGGSVQHLAWTRVPSAGEIGSAALLLVFAVTGTETALTASGEIERPAHTVPRALLLGLSSVSNPVRRRPARGAECARRGPRR